MYIWENGNTYNQLKANSFVFSEPFVFFVIDHVFPLFWYGFDM